MMKKITVTKKNLDIFFCFLNNTIFFQSTPITWYTNQLTRTMLFQINIKKNNLIRIQLWEKNRNLFFFKSIYNLYSSINKKTNVLHIYNGFFVKLDLIGLGFRIQKISEKVFFFSLGWANGVYFLVPEAIRVFVLSKKRQLIVFGFNINKVYNIISMFILLRKTRPYRITGFVNPIFIQRLRSGKQR